MINPFIIRNKVAKLVAIERHGEGESHKVKTLVNQGWYCTIGGAVRQGMKIFCYKKLSGQSWWDGPPVELLLVEVDVDLVIMLNVDENDI